MAVLWFAIVTAFTWYGGAFGVAGAIVWGGLGVSVATCLATGLWLLSLVYTRSVGKIEAVVWLAVSSLVSAILSVMVPEIMANMLRLPRDESWLVLGVTGIWAVTIAGGTFLMFIPIVIGIGKPPRPPRE